MLLGWCFEGYSLQYSYVSFETRGVPLFIANSMSAVSFRSLSACSSDFLLETLRKSDGSVVTHRVR